MGRKTEENIASAKITHRNPYTPYRKRERNRGNALDTQTRNPVRWSSPVHSLPHANPHPRPERELLTHHHRILHPHQRRHPGTQSAAPAQHPHSFTCGGGGRGAPAAPLHDAFHHPRHSHHSPSFRAQTRSNLAHQSRAEDCRRRACDAPGMRSHCAAPNCMHRPGLLPRRLDDHASMPRTSPPPPPHPAILPRAYIPTPASTNCIHPRLEGAPPPSFPRSPSSLSS